MPLVQRTRGVRPRRGLDATARRHTARGAFAARAGPVRLDLVDDVYTYPAPTVDECARALRAAGGRDVHVITSVRTPLDRTFVRAPPLWQTPTESRYPSGRYAMQLRVKR